MQVFLTGGSGFIGGHLMRELQAAGCAVRALSRGPESDALIRTLGAVPVRGTLTDPAALQAAVTGCEAVFHAAADLSLWQAGAAAQFATNVTGTQHLLRAAEAAGVRAFVHTSSVSAWGHLTPGVVDETVPQRGGASWIGYERSKYLGEQEVRASALPWILVNPAHVLGPGDHHNWSRLIVMIDRGQLPGIPPGIGSFADVRQVALAQVRAWQLQRFGQAYVLGGEEASFLDFARRVGAALGKPTPKRAMPPWALMGYARVLDAWSRLSGKEPQVTPAGAALTSHHLRVDSAKARQELGYVEKPLDTLLSDTLDWMRAEGMLGSRE
jgi:nucleoside-diphosphate-sugar epimerase